jgi:hypothetical protein
MAKGEAVLPAYLAALVVAGVFLNDLMLVNRMRLIAFTVRTHPILSHQVRSLRVVARVGAHSWVAVVLLRIKDADEIYRSIASKSRIWQPFARADVYDEANVYGADLWHHLGTLRPRIPHYLAGSFTGHGRDH